MRIAVIGSRGQLGAAILQECAAHYDLFPFSRDDLDVSDDRAVLEAMARAQPDVIINCAAYNDVDGAEEHPVEALGVNSFAVRALAQAAAGSGGTLVHYSSDFVFDGTVTAPYVEDDKPNPQSVYAASKLLGEWFAADAPCAYVLRVESLFGRAAGGPPPKGSITAIWRALIEGREARVFDDRTISPTSVLDAARATRELLEKRAAPGIYHCVNSGSCTWVELAEELARLLGVEPRLVPVHVADVPLRAQRPQYCALSNDKLRAIGIQMPTWQEALRRTVTA